MTAPDPDAWRTAAACRGLNPTLFFPDDAGTDMHAARNVCATCPVNEPCRQAGHGEQGLWGGTTETERRTPRTTHPGEQPRGPHHPLIAAILAATEPRRTNIDWAVMRPRLTAAHQHSLDLRTELHQHQEPAA